LLIGVNVTEMSDTGLILGQKYYYRVTGVTSSEEGPASNEVNATPCTNPGIPNSFQTSAENTSAVMNWTAPVFNGFASLLGYHIFRGVESGNLSQVASVSGLGYLDTGLAPGVTYYYKIAAFNAAGDGNPTPEVQITTPFQVDPPIGLTATASEGKVALAWNQPTGVSVFTYSIYRGNESGGEVILTNYPSTGWIDNNVTAGKTYYYKVSALTLKGESKMSEEAEATPIASHSAVAQNSSLFDQLWFRIIMIMTILVAGFFSFVIFVRKGAVQVKRRK
jgi:fibronectin type 3 domain-containing protein